MTSQTSSEGNAPIEDRYSHFKLELEQALERGGLAEDDPAVKKLFLDFFKDNDAVVSLISSHDGKISAIISQLDQLGVAEKRITEFCSSILDTQKGEEASVAAAPILVTKPVTLEFICDLDAPDHNGSMLDRFNSALECENPTITTRTLFRGARLEKNSQNEYRRDGLMKGIGGRYDIYESGGFLVFVPKKLGEELTEEERVEKLDLNGKALKKITIDEAWLQTEGKPSMEGFRKLFSDHPSHDKHLYIGGHGGVGEPGGLTLEHYKEFLEWAETQRCQGLLVTSCYSGGKSVMLHLPKKDPDEKIGFNQKPPEGVSFPVFIRSIGDFPTYSGQAAEKDVRSLFSRLTELLNTPGGRTVFRLKQALQEEEKGKEKKTPQNLVQVYFPHSIDSPGGFRPVGEGGESAALTFANYRREQIEKGQVVVADKSFVELSPANIECPIVFKGENSVILSQIPGQAHHFLQEVRLDGLSPKDFLLKNAAFYKKEEVGVTKTFFISKLKSDGKELNQVFADMKSGNGGYRKGDHYYLLNFHEKEDPTEVSPLQYILGWKDAIEASRPDAEALRAATGGHQDIKEPLKNLEQEAFWGDHKGDFDGYKELLKDEWDSVSHGDYLKLVESMKLTDAKETALINFILPRNEKLACELFIQSDLSPDSKDAQGVPFIIHASEGNSFEFVKLLLERGVDINLPDPKKLNTAIKYSMSHKDGRVFKLLISQDSVDLHAKNARENPTFASSMYNPEALRTCFAKDPTLDLNVILASVTGEKKCLLTASVESSTTEVVEFLLSSGADPDGRGDTISPLTMAVIQGNNEMIALLLKHGASPYKKDAKGHYPIVEAMRRSSLGEVLQLLKEKIPELDEEAKRELLGQLLLSAIESGEEAKIREVLKMNPTFPEKLDYVQKVNFVTGLNRLHLFGRDELIKEIVRMGGNNPHVEVEVCSWCMHLAPELLAGLMDKDWDLPEIVDGIIMQKGFPQHLRAQVIKKVLELGGDLNRQASEWGPTSLISIALDQEDIELARFLIENGADPNLAAEDIIKEGNMELVKVALDHGLQLEPEDSSKPTLLHLAIYANLSKKEVKDTFKWLIAQGADVDTLYRGVAPFFHVIAAGDKELYDYCLEHCSPKCLERKEELSSLIESAVSSNTPGGEQIAKDLVIRGGDLNATNLQRYVSPFSVVAQYGSKELVLWCLDHGAVISPENPMMKILPLQSAALGEKSEASEIFKLLVLKGGRLNQMGYNQSYPVIPVIKTGDLDLVKFCFDQGAKMEGEEVIQKAFKNALSSGNPEIVAELENRGYTFPMAGWEESNAADLLESAYSSGGIAMLEKAFGFGPPREVIESAGYRILKAIFDNQDISALRLLEAKGMVFDAKRIIGESPGFNLFSFRAKGEEVTLEIMGRLEKKDQVDFLNENLDLIVYQKQKGILKYALDQGADPNMMVREWEANRHLIFVAIEEGDAEIVKMILDAGADMTVTYNDNSPLSYAQSRENPEIIKLIESKV